MTNIVITTNNQLFVNNKHVGRVSSTSNPKWNVTFYDLENNSTELKSPAYNPDNTWNANFVKFCESL